ncbi:MAG: hypothetical protein FWG91_01190 [Lachnospiraceae bacterium]|nr:hypothetical protein [Lachnospiraceae bacterium]
MKKIILVLLTLAMLSITACDNADRDYIDLTALSNIMVSAEVNKMTAKPEDYLGKTIRLAGTYYSVHYAEIDTTLHAVLIDGSDSCCQLILEFKYADDTMNYPDEMDLIELTGVYGSYELMGQTRYYLLVDSTLPTDGQ